MRFSKKILCNLLECYAVEAIRRDGVLYYALASDGDGPCKMINAETGTPFTLWEAPGGTMSIIPVPGFDGEFLISRYFLPGFHSLGARILRARPDKKDTWRVEAWLDLPYVHRFDILKRGGKYYFLGCILSDTDKPFADFSVPGSLVAAELNSEFSLSAELKTIYSGMTRNHGYWHMEKDNYSAAMVSCDEGVFYVEPPKVSDDKWTVEKVLNKSTSDIALCDIDSDGADELAAIHPFHGDGFCVYKSINGRYEKIYDYPSEIAFAHVCWGGKLAGENIFIGGCRAKERELFMLAYKNGSIASTVIDAGEGPSNIAVFEDRGKQKILAANHEAGMAAVYEVIQ